MYLLAPQDLIMVRRRELVDHALWLAERQRYEQAMQAANESGQAELRQAAARVCREQDAATRARSEHDWSRVEEVQLAGRAQIELTKLRHEVAAARHHGEAEAQRLAQGWCQDRADVHA